MHWSRASTLSVRVARLGKVLSLPKLRIVRHRIINQHICDSSQCLQETMGMNGLFSSHLRSGQHSYVLQSS